MAVKCASCGVENPNGVRVCPKCSEPLVHPPQTAKTVSSLKEPARRGDAGPADHTKVTSYERVSYKDIPDKISFDYRHGVGDPNQKALDGLQSLLSHLRDPQINIDDMLLEAANFISRQFRIETVTIGLRDPKDGLYRYRAMVGLRDDAIKGHEQIEYRREEFFDDELFKGYDISKHSRLYLAEDNVLTEKERNAFNRPVLLTMKRTSTSDTMEGDYIDTRIWGTKDELLGWIEISGTRTMKLPDAATIKWVETVALIIGAALISIGSRKC